MVSLSTVRDPAEQEADDRQAGEHPGRPRPQPDRGRQFGAGAAEGSFAGGAKISLVGRRQRVVDVLHHHAHGDRPERRKNPALEKACRRDAGVVGEERRRVGVGAIEVQRDGEGIGDDRPVVVQYRHRFRHAVFDGRDMRERRRRAVEVEPLVEQRHAGAPAIGAEPHLRIASAQLVEDACHRVVLQAPRTLGRVLQRRSRIGAGGARRCRMFGNLPAEDAVFSRFGRLLVLELARFGRCSASRNFPESRTRVGGYRHVLIPNNLRPERAVKKASAAFRNRP